ncbi:MAG: BREX system ATP-binding domain-containing protein [Myxococcota bacterium]
MASVDKLWREHVVAARGQTLEDLAATDAANVAVLIGEESERLIRDLQRDALARRYPVSIVSLAEYPLSALDEVLREVAQNLRLPDVRGVAKHGLGSALSAFVREHGTASVERFDEFASADGLSGELRHLARQAIEEEGSEKPIIRWIRGRALTRTQERAGLRPLDSRTAKSTLVQFTRLLRTLGYPGTRLVFADAESLVDLSPGKREVAYTVLRELVDNADSPRGMIAAEVLLIGGPGLLDRKASIYSHPALASRLLSDVLIGPPQPHRPLELLEPPEDESRDTLGAPPRTQPVPEGRVSPLRAQLRIAQGLPPLDGIESLSVGMDQIDARLNRLFTHAAHDASVFALLVGDYGTGKTHHLMHLESRALADQRPVFHLSVERLDEDLGNPQRHLRRLLEQGVLPGRRHTGPFERLDGWLSRRSKRRELLALLWEIAESDREASVAASLALGESTETELDTDSVWEVLTTRDLEHRSSAPRHRRDAYNRLHLWLELLARLEGCEGPVIILDEAENLYRTGVSRRERRTAMRSLAFYCGGSLSRACVVLAVTPDTLEMLREEADELLDEIDEQVSSLAEEDPSMLRRRLRARPITISRLRKADLEELARRAYKLGRRARGAVPDPSWEDDLQTILRASATPREVVRMVAMRTERLAWSGVP